jgi:hypothetical protein
MVSTAMKCDVMTRNLVGMVICVAGGVREALSPSTSVNPADAHLLGRCVAHDAGALRSTVLARLDEDQAQG